LMGGATRMSLVTEFAQSVFGERVITSYNPDETVALGAAVLAALKEHDSSLKETVLTDICPFTLSTDSSLDGQRGIIGELEIICVPLIERNSPVPVSIVKRFYASALGQRLVRVGVFQGESLKPEENVSLGNLDVEIPVNNSEHEAVDVRFTYDINGLLEVEVTVVSTKECKKMLINQSCADLTDEEIKEAQEKMNSLKNLPWEEEENRAILERGMRLYQENVGEKREYIASLISRFEAALNSQRQDAIKAIAEEAKAFFDSLEDDEW
ncbi:MAG: Hsp70 family protein, partial [Treponema sp.]|nr:Hsp70 family protein [Treponema sp.]